MIDRDYAIAHEIIRDHTDRNDMGKLRSAIATALKNARREATEIRRCDKCDLCEDHHERRR